jgi:type IV secretion system protein VirD4
LHKAHVEENAAWLAGLGNEYLQRCWAINALYENRTATVNATYYATWSHFRKGNREDQGGYVLFRVSRSLATMDNREREYLRTVEFLNCANNAEYDDYLKWRAALLWGDGKGILAACQWQGVGVSNVRGATEAVSVAIAQLGLSVEQTINSIRLVLDSLHSRQDLNPEYRSLVDALVNRLSPSGSGAWLQSSQIAGTIFAANSNFPLHVGSFPDRSMLSYSGDGSMVTIAPPGSGKTQCNVFPNLLVWPGPAVVLDISGDIYEHTAAWRANNVGPVYKFSPLDPENSHKYNPLTFVRQEPDFLWEDARLLSEMMIVPSSTSDPFWENEARILLTSAIAYVCYFNSPAERPMSAVLDVLFGGKPWDDMILGLKMAVDVHVMTQHATALSAMNEKTLSSVLQTARSSLSAWVGERVSRATAASDWNPLDLRSGANPTIYISIRPNEVEACLSLLRVFIGQHIRVLTGGPVPSREAPPILIMLDELPRLRYMAPVDEALNIGRKYGLRLWMFAQSVGQLQNAYDNADGMLGSCAVRIYMNPSGADGLAERLSAELGDVDSLLDNSRKRLVDAAELAGPVYMDQQIVLGMGAKPVVVSKDFAWRNPELARRMSAGEFGGSG